MNQSSGALFQDLSKGVTCIDVEYYRPGCAASYLLSHGGEAAFIETGTSHAVETLLKALKARDLSVDAVKWIFVTHVHLDHAGGAGALMKACPQATLVVHPKGAKHLIDPEKLTQSATAVYGKEQFDRLFGVLEPVPASRVIEAEDGAVFSLESRPLMVMDAPGHAYHHFVVWDEQSRGVFTGDAFGLSYAELATAKGRMIIPATTPTQFDPDVAHGTLERIHQLNPKKLYLTHFSAIPYHESLMLNLQKQLHDMVMWALALEHKENRLEHLKTAVAEIYRQQLKDLDYPHIDKALEILAMDLEINTQGLDVWLKRRHKMTS
ncbi:MBL fold metallo-hydrolase [Magnetococcales bacterium HHB-1]